MATKIQIFILVLVFPAMSFAERMEEDSRQKAEDSFPVVSVTLYSAGLAQIVRQGDVEGGGEILVSVDHQDMDDILKSLRVEDLGGGRLESVIFSSSDPLGAVLENLRVNPAGSPPLAEFLSASQGEELRLETGEGIFSGRIFSMDESRDSDGRVFYTVNLMDEEGIRPVSLRSLKSLAFSDPQLQEELLLSLEEIARERIKSSRTLRIIHTGSGKRTLKISYVRSVPLWKTIYRAETDKEGNIRLEALALVQNSASEDWKDIRLSFVAGQPNAFAMDLSTPRYIPRETIEIPGLSPFPRWNHDQAFSGKGELPDQFSPGAEMPGEMEKSSLASRSNEAPQAPPLQIQARAERKGNYYHFSLPGTVTVNARSSTMIPILSQEKAGTSLAVFYPEQGQVFKAMQLKNTSDAHWPAGPVSVNEGREYAGDALLMDMVPGSSTYLPYALHGTVEVEKREESMPRKVESLKVSGGVLFRNEKMLRLTEYHISGKEELLILIHPKQEGWTLESSPPLEEEDTSAWHFLVKSWDRDPVIVREEKILSREYGMLHFSLSDYFWYLENAELEPEMSAAFQKMAEMKKSIIVLREERDSEEARLKRLEGDQSRIRENMGVLDRNSELYIRYSAQLSRQEDSIQNLNTAIDTKEKAILVLEQDLADFIASLEMD